MDEIKISFDNEGNPIVAVHGVKGKSCKDLTAFLEKGLGTKTSDKTTSEYFEKPTNRIVKHI